MDNKLKIDENVLIFICQKEANKIVGKCMKRFELSNDKEAIKVEIKELLYEFMRDLRDILVINGKDSINLINKDETKK
jgi:hypothetical protein